MNETLDTANYAAPPRTFGKAIKVCFLKYATFRGRASRSELWWFYLFLALLINGMDFLGILHAVYYEEPSIVALITVCVFFLFVAVCTRRLHDINFSGRWMAFGITGIGWIVLMCLWAKKGKPEKNKYDAE